MSVVDRDTVDGMALDEGGQILRLLIIDHLGWGGLQGEYKHLVALQEKINAYIAFCEERQYQQILQNSSSIKYAVIEIHFAHEPTKKAMQFLKQVQKQLNELGMTIECHIAG